ncbi:fibrillin-2-like [Sycon ciliatum]|uniref:fibrillin-2-like n=1 Tax=Sycon ciliatum TaxID=27933 RepID=UPI0031F70FBE
MALVSWDPCVPKRYCSRNSSKLRQLPENSQVIGLLNVDRDNGVDILQNITELILEGNEYQVNESTSPFSYSSQESFRTYNPINPPTTGIVDTRVMVDGCDDDATCIADYILSSDINLAKSTLASKRDLNMSTNTVARTPPTISMSQTALHGTYQAASTVTVVASPRAGLTIMSINYTANGITVSAQRVSPSSLVLSWTPTERHLNGSVSLHVTAADSNGDIATMTIPVALCSCYGTCQPLTSISLTEPFTQLGCASCEAGRTGSNCDEDLDSCITSPCSSSLHTCTDIPLPGDGFTCSCRAGFTESNGNCLDVNECVTGGGHSCPQGRSSCTNTAGSYLCQCSAGYTGDNCLDMDECSLDVNDCIRSRGSCINTAGSYECVCPEGFEGTGRQDYGGCGVVQCRTPKITNGKKNTSRILYGDTARYACDDGFRLLGDGSPNCTAEGKLTSLPKCVSNPVEFDIPAGIEDIVNQLQGCVLTSHLRLGTLINSQICISRPLIREG